MLEHLVELHRRVVGKEVRLGLHGVRGDPVPVDARSGARGPSARTYDRVEAPPDPPYEIGRYQAMGQAPRLLASEAEDGHQVLWREEL